MVNCFKPFTIHYSPFTIHHSLFLYPFLSAPDKDPRHKLVNLSLVLSADPREPDPHARRKPLCILRPAPNDCPLQRCLICSPRQVEFYGYLLTHRKRGKGLYEKAASPYGDCKCLYLLTCSVLILYRQGQGRPGKFSSVFHAFFHSLSRSMYSIINSLINSRSCSMISVKQTPQRNSFFSRPVRISVHATLTPASMALVPRYSRILRQVDAG